MAVDGAHKLRKSDWAALAEAERKGVVTIAKAAKDTAYARTRQIKIANPVDPESIRRETKNLDEFYYPALATGTFLDLMSVARLDLCVFSDISDVKAEQINRRFSGIYDERLHILAEVRKWVWSTNPEIVFTLEAEDALLKQATKIYNRFFYKKIPLASIDLKWKLGIMSASLAALTLSTPDYKSLIIEKEHVNWITKFIEDEYTKVGLHTLVESAKHEEATEGSVWIILNQISIILNETDTEKAKEILTWIAIKGRYVKEDLKGKFNLSEKNQLKPLNAYLSTEGLVKRGNGFYATTKLNRVCKIFATFATSATPQNGIPLQKKGESPKKPRGGIITDYGKQGKQGKTSNLQEDLNTLKGIFHEYPDELQTENTILTLLENPHGIDTERGRRLIGILERDGLIFQPRPGFYKATGGG